MFKNALKVLSIFLGVLFLCGCASKNVEVRHYIEVKDRVDQEIDGNSGYLFGTPQPEDRSELKTTRKIYVLEVSKGENIDDTVAVIEDDNYESSSSVEEPNSDMENVIEVFSGDQDSTYDDAFATQDDIDKEEPVKPSSSIVEYTVQKDDTLQKISKKFYDSYSKWSKIYEMNKDVIENPDTIKPGIILRIPIE